MPLMIDYHFIFRYTCTGRNWYFAYDVPEPENFVSYYYTNNVNEITITCNNHS